MGPFFGHKTSNVVESTNNVFKKDRELPILDLLNTIWHYVMNQRHQRYQQAIKELQESKILTSFAYTALRESQHWAHSNTVDISSITSGTITQSNKKTFIVDMLLRTCTCGHFNINGIPCGHAFSFIQKIYPSSRSTLSTITPRDYVPYWFTLLAWRETYRDNISPISIYTLTHAPQIQAPNILPPTDKVPRGRPKVKRFTSNYRKVAKAQARLAGIDSPPESGVGSQACRQCGKYGHNRATCTYID